MTTIKPFAIRISSYGTFYVLAKCRRHTDKDGVNRAQGEYIRSYLTFKGACNAVATFYAKGYWPDFGPPKGFA